MPNHEELITYFSETSEIILESVNQKYQEDFGGQLKVRSGSISNHIFTYLLAMQLRLNPLNVPSLDEINETLRRLYGNLGAKVLVSQIRKWDERISADEGSDIPHSIHELAAMLVKNSNKSYELYLRIFINFQIKAYNDAIKNA